MDAFTTEVFDCLIAEYVASNLGHESDFSAKSCGGYSLIGSLAASRHNELPARDRLTRRRQTRAFDYHVGIHAANDNDMRSFHLNHLGDNNQD